METQFTFKTTYEKDYSGLGESKLINIRGSTGLGRIRTLTVGQMVIEPHVAGDVTRKSTFFSSG